MLGEHGAHEARLVAEAAEQRSLADAGGGGDLLHRHAVGTALGEQPRGGREQLLVVAHGVRAQPRDTQHRQIGGLRLGDEREFG